MISRRVFLRDGGLALVGLGVVPSFLYRAAMAAGVGKGKILVTVFLRGGVDGLNMIVPFGEKTYYSQRPSIAIPPPTRQGTTALDLDGRFGFHPALAELLPLYQQNQLAVVHAVGSPHSTRSHFDAQDFIESGIPGDKTVDDGWINRYLQHHAQPAATPFRGVSMGSTLPRCLQGKAGAVAVGDINRFDLGGGQARGHARSTYEQLYAQDSNTLLSGTAAEMFAAIDMLKKANPSQYKSGPGVKYPGGPFGQKMRQVAQLIKANVGVELAFVDIGGWDTHVNQGNVDGQLSNLLGQLGNGLAAFHRDLGDRMENVVILTISEFGRTVRENGNGGTDHGHANVMMAIGGTVKGGRVYGSWPGLDRDQLYERRDLEVTTDFRQVFGEVLARFKGGNNLDLVFPGFELDHSKALGIV